ncbi:hypothetical protein BGY98DRAFT_934081 [Russula aff. rugulosa BPL654]|nr:hypothetical protein BGY98DRAFT_934081 [Russula aff. rugulosa BPL654]
MSYGARFSQHSHPGAGGLACNLNLKTPEAVRPAAHWFLYADRAHSMVKITSRGRGAGAELKALCLEGGAGWNRALARRREVVDGGRSCGDAENLAGPLVN